MQTIGTLKTQFYQLAHAHLPYHWFESLLLWVLDKDKAFLITHDDYLLSHDEYDRLSDGMAKLCTGMPLAYVIGRQGFFGHEFVVDEHTLIPRADTEILVETALAVVHDKGIENARLLDLGTGSGCIGISLAKALPDANVVLSDYSVNALKIAQINAKELMANNCTFVHSNWYDDVLGNFDIIISNPPYIARTDEHLRHLTAEPMTALVADDNGLADIGLIVTGALECLNLGGVLLVEHGHNQGAGVQKFFFGAGFKNIRTIKDYGGNDRMTMGIYDE